MTEHQSDDVQVTFIRLHTHEQEQEFERAAELEARIAELEGEKA